MPSTQKIFVVPMLVSGSKVDVLLKFWLGGVCLGFGFLPLGGICGRLSPLTRAGGVGSAAR